MVLIPSVISITVDVVGEGATWKPPDVPVIDGEAVW